MTDNTPNPDETVIQFPPADGRPTDSSNGDAPKTPVVRLEDGRPDIIATLWLLADELNKVAGSIEIMAKRKAGDTDIRERLQYVGLCAQGVSYRKSAELLGGVLVTSVRAMREWVEKEGKVE